MLIRVIKQQSAKIPQLIPSSALHTHNKFLIGKDHGVYVQLARRDEQLNYCRAQPGVSMHGHPIPYIIKKCEVILFPSNMSLIICTIIDMVTTTFTYYFASVVLH